MSMVSQVVMNCGLFGVEKIIKFLSSSFTNKMFVGGNSDSLSSEEAQISNNLD